MVEKAIVEHGPGTAKPFLGGLENEHRPTRQTVELGEDPDDPQNDRRVRVVAASVHLAGNLRFVGRIADFIDRQGVEVPSQGDTGAIAAFDGGANAGLAETALPGYAQLVQFTPDHAGSLDFLETKFGIFMHPPTNGDEIGRDRLDETDDIAGDFRGKAH